MRFSFSSELSSPQNLYLILENPEIYKIKVNDKIIKYKDIGYYVDTSFKKIDISKIIKKGRNFIELSCLFKLPTKPKTLIFKKDGVELESIYLIGDFEVEGKFKKEKDIIWGKEFKIKGVRSPQSIKSKDLVTDGYPFYVGSFLFSQRLNLHPHLISFPIKGEDGGGGKIFLKFENFNAIVAKVNINKKEVCLVFLPPYQIEVTKFLKKGENLLEIEVTNSLRNLLGPHHHQEAELLSVGPYSFSDEKNWTDNYSFLPFGLGKIKLIIKERNENNKRKSGKIRNCLF
ncbi:hypothetical protein ES708_32871 [subsurface metagenome]